jgi:ribosomal protein S18 acetylase RimI-like enzyme
MNDLSLRIRTASETDFGAIESMVIASFEAVTWARAIDARFGRLNGYDWQHRWKQRLEKIFTGQIVLVGEDNDGLAAASTSTLDERTTLAYIDILAVAPDRQRRGYGREMLRGTLRYLKSLGAQYANLDCLTNNFKGNELYQSEGFEEMARHIRWFRKL